MDLKCDGISSVNDFLEGVEKLRISWGVSKQQLIRSATELFTHDAFLWYRTNRFLSWDDFVVQLRDAVQPYDYNGIWHIQTKLVLQSSDGQNRENSESNSLHSNAFENRIIIRIHRIEFKSSLAS